MKYLVICATIALTSEAYVSLANASVTIMGVTDCARWTEKRTNVDMSTFEMQFWLAGFLTGLSVSQNEEFFNRSGQELSINQIFLWMDNYCKANPLQDVADGAIQMFQEVVF